jgi:uncharacterized protein YkwD
MRKLLTPLGALAAIATMVASIAVVPPSATAATEPGAAASQFFDLLNQARIDRGLSALARDSGLDNLAVGWSTQMHDVYAKTHVISAAGDCSTHGLCHNPNLGANVQAIEPDWQRAGENIGTGFSVQSLHDALMASPPHFENIVGDYNRLGVGVANDADGRIWVTFDFMKGPALVSSEPTQSQPLATSPHAAVVPLGTNARFTVMTPTRVVDTRSASGPVSANEVLILKLAANGFVPAGATSAVLNMTAIGTQGDGFLSAYPCGRTPPDASSVNYVAGHAVPNLVTVALGTNGDVCVVTSTQAHVIADLEGWYGASGVSRYTPAAPLRLLDSRSTGRASTFKVTVAPGALAVTLNATVDGPTGGGYVTAYPCGAAAPNASNLNFDAGQTVANQVTVAVGPANSVCFDSTVATNLIVDLSGAFSTTGSQLTTVVPSRFLDTRFGIGGWMGRIGAGQTVDFALGGTAGIPSATAGVVLNVTVAGADASGFLTVYPCDQTRPNVSNLNFVAGQAVANAVTVKLAANGRLCVYASSRADVLVDLAGYLGS